MILDQLFYSVIGFGVVLATLASLWLLTLLISQLVKAMGLDKVKAHEVPAQSQEIPGETIAVITAAVSFATGGSAAIKDIKKIS